MITIGVMPMPADFKYLDVLMKGRPVHRKADAFSARHPNMEIGKRAKIFAPFDALRGFNAAILAKNDVYEFRRELGEEEQAELSRRLGILRELTLNGRLARGNRVTVTVTFFVPCTDRDSDAYGFRGQYRSVSGLCRKADPDVTRTLLLDEVRIRTEDILRIEAAGDIFKSAENVRALPSAAPAAPHERPHDSPQRRSSGPRIR